MDDSDETLIDRAVKGDRGSFSRLIERYYDVIFRLAWRWSGKRSDAEDIAQEVCVSLARSLDGFDGRAHFKTWLYRVVMSKTTDYQRKRQSQERMIFAWAQDPTSMTASNDGCEVVDDGTDRLWDAVRQLPKKQCDAVLLVYGEELSHAEAARVMGCAEGTVSFNIHQAKKKLKELLSDKVSAR